MKRRQAIKSFLGASILPFVPFKQLIAADECLTTDDILGPYFAEGAPNISNIAPITADVPRLLITGTVYANDCVTPIPNALIDVWQANNDGAYEDIDYRGKLYTDEGGNYAFESIQPGKYLNGSYYRPSHIHYKVVYKNNPELVTQLYFEGDSTIDIDPWASDPSAIDRIIPLSTDASSNLNGVFDIYMNVDPELVDTPDYSRNDISSRIESIFPNPVIKDFELSFYTNTNSAVTLDICDLMGRQVGVLLKGDFNKKLHRVKLEKTSLKTGLYVIRLTVNGKTVDAKRLLIQ
jgi:protocatechuate 3,4-dioxygenase beta subunit